VKRLLPVATLAAFALTTGCSDKEARDYAALLVTVVERYQAQIGRKVAAERKSYKDLAGVFAQAQTDDMIDSLLLDRTERSQAVAAQLVNGEIAPSRIPDLLRAYAAHDFDQTRQIFQREMDAGAHYLAGLEDLNAEAEKIETLHKLLQGLADGKGLATRSKDLTAFAQATAAQYSSDICKDLLHQIDVATQLKSERVAIVKDLESKEAIARKKPDEKAADSIKRRKDIFQAEADAYSARIAALQGSLSSNSQYDSANKRCK
jgi:hypothetical protein